MNSPPTGRILTNLEDTGAVMVDVFVSYAREDLNRAQPIVSAIIDRGWDVWWDRDLSAGHRFDMARVQELILFRLVRICAEIGHMTPGSNVM